MAQAMIVHQARNTLQLCSRPAKEKGQEESRTPNLRALMRCGALPVELPRSFLPLTCDASIRSVNCSAVGPRKPESPNQAFSGQKKNLASISSSGKDTGQDKSYLQLH